MSRCLRTHGELLADHPADVPLIIALQQLALNRGCLHEIVRQGATRL
jgi:hypothetical protein